MGVPDNRVSVMSGIPIRTQAAGPPSMAGTGWRLVALLGALMGLAAALTVVDRHTPAVPAYQGGQPLIPIPPSIIITFELTMLGTMWVTFGGFVLLNRFPRFGQPIYDPRITAGKIGVLVEADEARAGRVATCSERQCRRRAALTAARPQWIPGRGSAG